MPKKPILILTKKQKPTLILTRKPSRTGKLVPGFYVDKNTSPKRKIA